MTNHQPNQQSDQDDLSLILFLKQHRPIAPPVNLKSCLDLELKLMQQINSQISKTPKLTHWQALSKIWLVPVIVLLSGIALWSVSDRAKLQPSLAEMNTQEKQQLEATLVKGWLISTGEDPEEVNAIDVNSESSN
jgi:hypothetical protein